MITLKGKHTVAEVEGVRCTIVGTGLTENRKEFLRDLLAFNGYEVRSEKEKAKDGTPLETWVLGVTDVLFNPTIALYGHRLRRKDGGEVTPAYWEQWNDPTDVPYWHLQHSS